VSDWSQVGENLVKHKAGVIYLSAKVGGKKIRKSLGTDDLRIAKLKRDEVLAALRKAARNPTAQSCRTMDDALTMLQKKIEAQADLEAPTVDYYKAIFRILRSTIDVNAPVKSYSHSTASAWWRKVNGQYAPQRANNALGLMKRLGKMLVQMGVIIDDPWADLRRKKIPETKIPTPSLEQIDNIIADIRAQGKARSGESADFVAFLAFSGCRLGQAQALLWSDVGDEWITFRSGIAGTKGADTRKLPVNARLRSIFAGMKRGKGKVFAMRDPHQALGNSCERLGLPHLRLHDLRHFFASWGMECGVDVRTLAEWLGHKDGGVLLLKRYAHVRDNHSQNSAGKLK
jgi:integrase